MKKVTVKLLNDGGYDGLKHLEFPITVKGSRSFVRGSVIDVPISELLRIGYDMDAGLASQMPDCEPDDKLLPFFINSEAVIV